MPAIARQHILDRFADMKNRRAPIIGGGAGSYVYPWLANTLISLVPRLAKLGLSLPPDVAADHTLAGRMEEEAVRLGSQILAPAQFGAWTRKP